MGYLTVRDGDGRRIHELGELTFVGRGASCQILLDDLRSSKRHVEIRQKAGRFLLRDLNSTNGTKIQGQDVKSEVSIQDGDEVEIGDTTLVFTRGLPPGAEEAVRSNFGDSGTKGNALSKKQGLQIPGRGYKRIPKGTVVIPLERFGLHGSEKEKDTAVLKPTEAIQDKDVWLRSLYSLLREANQCDTEDDLFSTATRILSEALPGSRVRVLFETYGSESEAGGASSRKNKKTMHLIAWSGATQRGHKTTRILDDKMAEARSILLTHARERCVAVLSPDIEIDARVREGSSRKSRKTTQVIRSLEADDDRSCISLLIAPLLTGQTALGYIVVERTFKKGTSRARKNVPFEQNHLEFLAAAAYPLAAMLERLRRRQRVLAQNERLRERVATSSEIVGKSEALKATMNVVQRVAPLNSPVLILGESGTGKELIARALHEFSLRSKGPFEALNCAALPEHLVESELFGHAKGAFTGATRDRAGYFETASGGTLFLDEVGELPFPVQAKFLRVLEESKVVRVGESRLRSIDSRIIAATNRDLAAEVEAGNFRRDLYYRLRVMEVLLPPLRERLDDLAMLAKHLLKPFGNFSLHPSVLQMFRAYSWPGNIRELRNALERMAVLAGPTVKGTRSALIQLGVEDVPLDIRGDVGSSEATSSPTTRRRKTEVLGQKGDMELETGFLVHKDEVVSLEELQVAYARWVVAQMKGNKSKAARMLGIQRSTLYAWTDWRDKKKKKESD